MDGFARSLEGIFGLGLDSSFKAFCTATRMQSVWLRIEEVWKTGCEGRKDPDMPIGSLGLKDEPGKVRVFAMVDPVTQWVMYPLHKAIFQLLGRIPQDATFDQDDGVERVRQMLEESDSK